MTVYIGHAMANLDKKAGDSSGKEVKVSKFIYSESKGSVYNWTFVFRPKRNADKAATMCEKACANNYIGYCGSGKATYGKHSLDKLAPKVKYDLSKITTKTGCSCGDLICLSLRYAGLSKVYIGSAVPLAKALKKNGNFNCYKFHKGMKLKRGDVLITAHSSGKNNHVVLYLGATYTGKFPNLPKRGYFKAGDTGVNVQRLQYFLNWAVETKLTGDGEVGPKTIAAVIAYQKKYGLTPDGEFGNKSLAKAKKVLK